MRRLLAALALSTLIGGTFAHPCWARVWTDASGANQVEADYVGKKDGKVILRKPDGKLATVPINRLSAEDQKYVAGLPATTIGRQEPEKAAAATEPAEADRFTEAIEQNPNDHSAYYTRGMARLNEGRYSEAMADFNKALELEPNFAPAYDGRGVAKSKMGKALQAHADFDKAIELDPELASAYRHRGDNVKALWDTPEGKEMLKQRAEKYREKYEKARASNLTKTPWQPLNTTAGNTLPALNQMRQVDYLRAREIEDAYGGGVDGGYGVGGGGVAIGNGGVKIVNGGLTVVNPGTKIVGNPPLSVYPEEVVQGQTITLVANPAELSKAMPVQLGPDGKPIRRKGAYGEVPREPVYAVDFYRDVDGDGLLKPEADDYLASDNNGKDGFTAEVSTAGFPPGNQAYFAVGRGKQPDGVPSSYGQAAEAVKNALKTEREIAEASEEASDSGYTVQQAQDLRGDQKQIAETTQKMAQAFAQTSPEAAQALAQAAKAMQAVDTRLDAGEKRPGVPSIAEGATKKANEAADLLDQAYAKLAEQAQGEEGGEGSPSPAAPAGGAAVASGKVKPAQPGPAQTAGGPGKPGPGKPGPGSDGGYDADDGDQVASLDDDDIDINVSRDRDDDDRDINVHIDDDEDDVEVRDTIDRALGYIDEDDDYDRAVLEYDRYLVDHPEDDDVLLHRADAYVQRGSYDYAVRDYDRLVAMNVESADLYYNRGCAHLAAGRIDMAIEDFNKSIALDETRNLAYTNRGSAKARKGLYKAAIEDFDMALKLDPHDTLALRNRALAYKKLGQLEKYNADIVHVRELTTATSSE